MHKCFQYSAIRIGPVVKRDVMKASAMLEHESQYATILAFDVKVSLLSCFLILSIIFIYYFMNTYLILMTFYFHACVKFVDREFSVLVCDVEY